MIYEYRVYEALPGKLPLVVELMGRAAPAFEKYGMKVVGFWTPIVGEASNRFIYILGFESMEHRQKAWASFLASPEWKEIGAEWARQVPTSKTLNSLLNPTSYSPLH